MKAFVEISVLILAFNMDVLWGPVLWNTMCGVPVLWDAMCGVPYCGMLCVGTYVWGPVLWDAMCGVPYCGMLCGILCVGSRTVGYYASR